MGLSSKQVISSDGHSWNNNNNISTNNNSNNNNKSQQLKCPRCDSSNTKFCYYNNYNKSQPRHFCKACKRHWTKGGTLRNVLAGGARRKNKRIKTATAKPATSTATTTLFTDVSNFSDPFYQTLPCLSPTVPLFQPEQFDPRFEYSNLGIFESNPCSISSNYGSPNVYNFTGDGINSSLSSGSISDHHQQNWEIAMNCNSGWNYFDEFVSGEPDLTIPWDEDYAEIKR